MRTDEFLIHRWPSVSSVATMFLRLFFVICVGSKEPGANQRFGSRLRSGVEVSVPPGPWREPAGRARSPPAAPTARASTGRPHAWATLVILAECWRNVGTVCEAHCLMGESVPFMASFLNMPRVLILSALL